MAKPYGEHLEKSEFLSSKVSPEILNLLELSRDLRKGQAQEWHVAAAALAQNKGHLGKLLIEDGGKPDDLAGGAKAGDPGSDLRTLAKTPFGESNLTTPTLASELTKDCPSPTTERSMVVDMLRRGFEAELSGNVTLLCVQGNKSAAKFDNGSFVFEEHNNNGTLKERRSADKSKELTSHELYDVQGHPVSWEVAEKDTYTRLEYDADGLLSLGVITASGGGNQAKISHEWNRAKGEDRISVELNDTTLSQQLLGDKLQSETLEKRDDSHVVKSETITYCENGKVSKKVTAEGGQNNIEFFDCETGKSQGRFEQMAI